MSYIIETKDNKVTFTITVPAEAVTKAMKHAARHLAEHTDIPGFRPGKADYETIKQRLGEMQVLEAATEDLIRSAFTEAMLAEDLDTVGQPFFDMIKLAPENEMIFTAVVSLMPKIKKLADYDNLKVEKNDVEPSKEMIQRAGKDLTQMQTKEIRAAKKTVLKKGHKAVVNLTMKKDGVVLEGGEGRDHGIYTGEDYFIPGFIDEILGMKEDDKRNFTLKFPTENFQKHLAGQDIDFDVGLKEIFKLEAPEINDEFAKTLGLKDKADLDEKLKENLRIENEKEEDLRQDREVLELIAKKSDFEEIPDLLVNQEIEQMITELKHSLTQRGMDFDEYLKQIKKGLADLKLDMAEGALTRVKVALVLKEVAKKESVTVDEKAADEALDKLAENYEDKETKEKIYSPQYREYLTHQMRNRKTIDVLKEKMVK